MKVFSRKGVCSIMKPLSITDQAELLTLDNIHHRNDRSKRPARLDKAQQIIHLHPSFEQDIG